MDVRLTLALLLLLPALSFAQPAGYMNWFQQPLSGSDFYNRHIALLTIAHSISLKEN